MIFLVYLGHGIVHEIAFSFLSKSVLLERGIELLKLRPLQRKNVVHLCRTNSIGTISTISTISSMCQGKELYFSHAFLYFGALFL